MADTSIQSGIPRNKRTGTIENGPHSIEEVRFRAYAVYESRGSLRLSSSPGRSEVSYRCY